MDEPLLPLAPVAPDGKPGRSAGSSSSSSVMALLRKNRLLKQRECARKLPALELRPAVGRHAAHVGRGLDPPPLGCVRLQLRPDELVPGRGQLRHGHILQNARDLLERQQLRACLRR